MTGTRDSGDGTSDKNEGERSALAAAVLDALEHLDDARSRAKVLLEDVFLRLVRHRYPLDSVVELDRVSVLQGHVHGATRAKVRKHFNPDVSLERPENTLVFVECVTLRKDGSETRNVIRFGETVLGRAYVQDNVKQLSPRDQLVKLIDEMQAVEATYTSAAPAPE